MTKTETFPKDIPDALRDADDAYFYKYAFIYKPTHRHRSPFIAITETEVRAIAHLDNVFSLDDKVMILHAWPGTYHTDVFITTVGELRRRYNDKFTWKERETDDPQAVVLKRTKTERYQWRCPVCKCAHRVHELDARISRTFCDYCKQSINITKVIE